MKTLFLILFLLSSCSTVNMQLGGKVDRRPITERKNFYLFGLVGEHRLLVKDYCSKGISKIKEENTISDSILSIITLGIYFPRTVQIYCRI